MIRRVWDGFKNVLGAAARTKKFAGSDLKGNKYYHVLDEENKWKRIVEFSTGEWEPNAVPQLWNLWLYYQRDTPPTRQEELDVAEYQRVMGERVKKLEQEDQLKRKKELESGHTSGNKEYTPDQFFVGWKRKIQQSDGSIDVDTNKKS